MNAARAWRPRLGKTVFIGIAGSAGKTMTKELMLGMISAAGRSVGSRGSLNALPEVAKTVLRVRPSHDFCVAELSESLPGSLEHAVDVLQPRVGIVTVVGSDHLSAYDSHDGIADEIGALVAGLPAAGTAVLNADDARVLAMSAKCGGTVITYGTSPHADLRAEDATSEWPDRLRMTLVRGSERVGLQTQLCGTHWIPSVLGAIGGGLASGMTLQACAQGIARIAPFEGRMQPVTTADGITFIRDDWKAPLWTVDASFEFMNAARSRRKIIVIGTLSDFGTGTGAARKYAEVSQRAQQIADVSVFVGPWASSVLKTRIPGREDALRAYSHVRDAAHFVNSIARDGDLVLLKGTAKQDHLLRIILAHSNDVACWRDDCDRNSFCDECPHRTEASDPAPIARGAALAEPTTLRRTTVARRIDSEAQVIVGLGNPEPRYAGTPHNVGHEVVDHLAATLGLAWEATPTAWVARGTAAGRSICLLKTRTAMNLTGALLKQLADSLSFAPAQCILVHDDLDMPLGAVRARLSGGAGGHRGVASILEAFQTDAFRRVKIGVGQPAAKLNRVDYVLTVFSAESRPIVDQALATAASRVSEMVERSAAVRYG